MSEVMMARNVLQDALPLEAPGVVVVSVAAENARLSLRVAEHDIEAASAAYGVALPRRVGEIAREGTRQALCLGPDEWFLLADPGEVENIEAAFSALDVPHSLVDISHRELGINVTGRGATDVLSAICARDLAALPVGRGTRTILDRAQVILFKHAEDDWRIEVWQSFAAHVWGLLSAIVTEYRVGF